MPESYNQLSHAVIGAAMEVHRSLGPGFLEQTYEQALCVELQLRRIQFRRQVVVPIHYKGVELPGVRMDLIVDERIVLELKAVESIAPLHRAQLVAYLRAGGYRLGLLVNFNVYLLRDGVTRVIETSPAFSTAGPRTSTPPETDL